MKLINIQRRIYYKNKSSLNSVNIGPGFDILGLALKVYNEFEINKSDKWEFIGFDSKHSNEDNLICINMKKTYKYAHKNEKQV